MYPVFPFHDDADADHLLLDVYPVFAFHGDADHWPFFELEPLQSDIAVEKLDTKAVTKAGAYKATYVRCDTVNVVACSSVELG